MRRVEWLLALLAAAPAPAQWTLGEVVRRAGETNPGVQAAFEQASAAAAGVQLARTAWLPRADFLTQANRATRNNVFGMLMPNRVVAPISGPPLARNAGTNVWGTATGFLASWEPFDLGQRQARLDTAAAERLHAVHTFARERFETEAAAADAFFSVLAADRLVASANAGLERARALETVTTALAEAGLKPGADAARARAERAGAEAQVIQAEQAARVTRAALARITGGEAAEVKPQPGPLLDAEAAPPEEAGGAHPLLTERQAALDAAEARRKELDVAWRPRFEFQTGVYARGTGANPDGTTGGAGAGLYPNIYNWGAGFSVTFPILDRPVIRARQQIETSRAAAEAARLRQARQDIGAQVEAARAALEGARRLSQTTPVQLEAARAAHEQAQARYQSGLTGIVEVAEAQRLLTQGEIDDSLARLNVWRAQLGLATAQGDLLPFLARVEGR